MFTNAHTLFGLLAICALIFYWRCTKARNDALSGLFVVVGCVLIVLVVLNWDTVGSTVTQFLHIPTTHAAPPVHITPTPVHKGGK